MIARPENEREEKLAKMFRQLPSDLQDKLYTAADFAYSGFQAGKQQYGLDVARPTTKRETPGDKPAA
jgi:hypothetical protein